MACLRGDDARAVAIPPVQLLDEAGAIALVASTVAGLEEAPDDEGFFGQVRGLELLGLLDAGLIDSETDLVDVGIESILAFYLVPTKEIVIIDRGEPLNNVDAVGVLGHEFVHALQDGEHDLLSFGDELNITSDASLAVSSVVEGEATLYQLLMMSAYAGVAPHRINYDALFDFVIDNADESAVVAGSPLVTASSIFPYTYGAQYMSESWRRGGDAALDALYSNPPTSTHEIMFGVNATSPVPIESPGAMPAPIDGYTFVADDVAGAWVIYGLLAVQGLAEPGAALRELISGWRGDRFWLYERQDAGGEVAALWTVRFDDESHAAAFADMMRRFQPPQGGTSRVVQEGPTSHLIVAERPADLDAWSAQLEAMTL
jgi:hypothetical protein